jgi:hypothetical protein
MLSNIEKFYIQVGKKTDLVERVAFAFLAQYKLLRKIKMQKIENKPTIKGEK